MDSLNCFDSLLQFFGDVFHCFVSRSIKMNSQKITTINIVQQKKNIIYLQSNEMVLIY